MVNRIEELMGQLRREKVCDGCLEHVKSAIEQIVADAVKEAVEDARIAQIVTDERRPG